MASFKETVKQIEKAEKNVDKVLKAARLQRHEKQSNIDMELIPFMVCVLIMFLSYVMLMLNM